MEKMFFSIHGNVDSQVYEEFFSFVERVIKNKAKEIVIIINSNGGEITYGLAIYDLLMALDIEITTIAVGKCRSIATVIFAAGKKRFITKNCYFLIHGISVNIEKERLNARAARELLESIDEDNKRILQCYFNTPEFNTNRMFFKELFNSGNDLEYTPEEVVELGFATDILNAINDVVNIN